jgi:hypothetical protein
MDQIDFMAVVTAPLLERRNSFLREALRRLA